jgi:SAM-dependent methyltransferase
LSAAAAAGSTRLYGDLATWWPLVSDPADYAGEAQVYGDLLASLGPVQEVLELGSGGGHTAGHLKRRFGMTLSDVSESMLQVSRRAHPELDHVLGDMRSLRLGARFDAVFLHDALAYLGTEDDLAATLATAREHCRDGGTVLCVPDCVRETHAASTTAGGGDGDGRSLRFLEWISALQEGGPAYTVDYAFLMREGDGPVQVAHDHHQCGAHPRAAWLELCHAAKLEPERRVLDLPDPDHTRVEVFLCRAV